MIGFAMSILLRILFTIDKGNDFVWLRGLWSSGEPLTKREIGDLNIAITTAVLFTVCAGWFLFSMLFYKKSKKEYVDRVEEFFTEMDTPINRAVEHEPDYESDSRQYGVLGNLCAVYGAFIMILVLVPNVFSDRMLFVYSGGFMFVVGVILKKIARRIANKNAIQN